MGRAIITWGICLACFVLWPALWAAAARSTARLQEVNKSLEKSSVEEYVQDQPLSTLHLAQHHRVVETGDLSSESSSNSNLPTHHSTPGVQEVGKEQQHYHIKGHHKHAGEQFKEPEEVVAKPTLEQSRAAEKAYGMSQRVARLVDQAIEAITANPDNAERVFAELQGGPKPALKKLPAWKSLQAAVNLNWAMPTGDAVWDIRGKAVRVAAEETWAVYEAKAMGRDELQPLTQDGRSAFGDLGAMLIDSLSTLSMLNFQPELERALSWVANKMPLDQTVTLSLFETTIRIVGGLVSAYDLSGNATALTKAEELVQKLLPAFEGGVLPSNHMYFNSPQQPGSDRVCLAEFGSLQMEFWALSDRTGDPAYAELVEGIIRHLDSSYPGKGLQPTWFNRTSGLTHSQVVYVPQQVEGATAAQAFYDENEYAVGAMTDSYYEYLLKMWLLKGKGDDMYRRMWERAMDESLEKLYTISLEGLAYMGKRRGDVVTVGMDHLSCFFPGMLALGAMQGAVDAAKAAYYLEAAQKLTHTCYQMYARTATGLCPEAVRADPQGNMQIDNNFMNDLRPETVESLFYLWRATRDPKYREWGWDIFRAFQAHSRTPEGAYARVQNVNQLPAFQENFMESFWLAETLKYLWLLFGPDELLDLNQWVLNTEAHPLRIAKRA